MAPPARSARSGGPLRAAARRAASLRAQDAPGWSTIRLVWKPAIAMATLPYRIYRVYRWAEAESHRSRRAPQAAQVGS